MSEAPGENGGWWRQRITGGDCKYRTGSGKSSGKGPWDREIHLSLVLWRRSTGWRHRVLKKQVSLDRAWMNRRQEGVFGVRYGFTHNSTFAEWLLLQCSGLGVSLHLQGEVVPCPPAAPWLIFGCVQLWFDFKPHGEFFQCGGPSKFPAAGLSLNRLTMLDKNKLSDNMRRCMLAERVWCGGG